MLTARDNYCITAHERERQLTATSLVVIIYSLLPELNVNNFFFYDMLKDISINILCIIINLSGFFSANCFREVI